MIDRIISKIYQEPNGCWNSTTYKDKSGYSKITAHGKNKYMHRIVYEILIGKIKKGMVLDHVCRNKYCCHPFHLREVTTRQNVLENSDSLPAKNVFKTVCKRGHPLSGDNVKIYNRKRKCLECNRENALKFYRKNRRLKNENNTTIPSA